MQEEKIKTKLKVSEVKQLCIEANGLWIGMGWTNKQAMSNYYNISARKLDRMIQIGKRVK